MPILELDDATIHYEEYGSGYPVLMFAPGFLSSRIERWWTNPAKPGVPQAWADPIPVLSPHFRLIALDVRNAGQSRGRVAADHDWRTYTRDHLALLAHLGVRRCHVFGACIGVSFAMDLAVAQPDMVSALVLQNPIGLDAGNRAAIEEEFDHWVRQVSGWENIDENVLPAFGRNMFGGDFLFSVSREDMRECRAPVLLMPGDDLVHSPETSADIAKLAPQVEVLEDWKGPEFRDEAARQVGDFLIGVATDR